MNNQYPISKRGFEFDVIGFLLFPAPMLVFIMALCFAMFGIFPEIAWIMAGIAILHITVAFTICCDDLREVGYMVIFLIAIAFIGYTGSLGWW